MTRPAKTSLALLLITLGLLGTGAGLMTDGELQQTRPSSSPNASTIFAHPLVHPLMAMAQPQAASARAAVVVVAGVTPPDMQVSAAPQPGPPFPGLPGYGAIVHLKGGICNQVVSLKAKTVAAGGRGILFIADPSPTTVNNGFHWVATDSGLDGHGAFGIPTGRVYSRFWLESWPGTVGRFQISWASSDCLAADGNYLTNATVVTLTITG